jgi:hypothetical protein
MAFLPLLTHGSAPHPAPVLAFTGKALLGGETHYQLGVRNWASYPDSLFAAAPGLPPCSIWASASRTRVDIHNAATDDDIFSYCLMGSAAELSSVSYSVGPGISVPSAVYVTLNDRSNGMVYRSNTVAVSPYPPPMARFAEKRAVEGGTRHTLAVENRATYPAVLFYEAPDLPPCGQAAGARTWVRVHDGSSDEVLSLDCLLDSPDDLGQVHYTAHMGEAAPSSLYLTLEDRLNEVTYRSDRVVVADPPAPVLAYGHREGCSGGVRHYLHITNWGAYTDTLFIPAPDLPPCGQNENASSTSLDIHDGATGDLVHGYCDLSSAHDLGSFSFVVGFFEPTPETVYVTLTDRRQGIVYRSREVAIPPGGG